MKAHILAATAATFLLGATSLAAAQATTGDQNSGVDARSHPSTTTQTQSSTQSGADLGTGMAPAPNNSSASGHDDSGMRNDAASVHSSTTAHHRHHTSHTSTTSTTGAASGDSTDPSATPR